MTLPPEVIVRIEAIEARLTELDPILHAFCARRGYQFRRQVGVWPRRMVWVREEIDRTISLTMDLSVAEVMERGFYLAMPWSLYGNASLRPAEDWPTRILNLDIFQGLAFSQLAGVLEARLEEALAELQKITRTDIIERGRIYEST